LGCVHFLEYLTGEGGGNFNGPGCNQYRSKILSLFLEMCWGHFGIHSGNRRTQDEWDRVSAAAELQLLPALFFSKHPSSYLGTIVICTLNIRVNNTTKPTGLRRNVWIINRWRHAQVSVPHNINYSGHSSSKFGTHPHTHTRIANSLLIITCLSALSRSKRSCCSLCIYNCLPPTNSLLAERHYPSSILQDASRIHLGPDTGVVGTRQGRRAPPRRRWYAADRIFE